jgi:hypothetical protein
MKKFFLGPIERQNVQLAQSVFDESTANALEFYGKQGHSGFLETAKFIFIISSWWKQVNVKGKFHHLRKRDKSREPVSKENLVEKTSFLRGFVDWLKLWEDSTRGTKKGLSRETFQCSQHSSAALAALMEFLIREKKFDYFLTSKAQSDKIEKRFGKSRQMSGGNLYASVRQFLESDRTLRIKNLAKLNLSMADVKEIFSECSQIQREKEEQIAIQIFQSMDSENTIALSPPVPEAEINILFNVSGGFANQLCRQTKCLSCKERLAPSDFLDSFVVINEADENCSSSTENQRVSDYFDQVNRGGLTMPSELSFLTCIQAFSFYNNIIKDLQLKSLLHSQNVSSKKIFQKSFVKYLDSCDQTRNIFLLHRCDQSHIFQDHVILLAGKIFNLFSKNYASFVNSEIHSKRGRKSDDCKRDPLKMKVAKVQSKKI